MKVEQVYTLVNNVTSEILGKSDVVAEDLSNIVEVGKEIFVRSLQESKAERTPDA